MRNLTIAASLAGALVTTVSVAQAPATRTPPEVVHFTPPPGPPLGLGPSKKLDTSVVAPDELAKGASTITEAQARTRIQATGFSSVTELRQDSDGIWRAKAMSGNRIASVALDHKGNIAAQ